MKIRYCLECAEPLTKNDDTCYECANGHEYFNNPHVGTSIIFLRGGEVLMAKRRIEPHKGKYGFVGGFLNYGEDPYVAAQREAKEETGVDVTELELLDVCTHHYGEHETTCSVVYLAKEWKGTFRAHDDVEALVWKPIEFIKSDAVAWHYPGMADKLLAIVKK